MCIFLSLPKKYIIFPFEGLPSVQKDLNSSFSLWNTGKERGRTMCPLSGSLCSHMVVCVRQRILTKPPTELSVGSPFLMSGSKVSDFLLPTPYWHWEVKWVVDQTTNLLRRWSHRLHFQINGLTGRWAQNSHIFSSFLRSSYLNLFQTTAIWSWEGLKSFQLSASKLKPEHRSN